MNNTELQWGDVKITIGGREIIGISELSYNGGRGSGKMADILSKNCFSMNGTFSLSKKEVRKLKRLCRAKKIRLPRKRKKLLKKAIKTRNVELHRKLMPKGCFYISCDISTGKDYSSVYTIKI